MPDSSAPGSGRKHATSATPDQLGMRVFSATRARDREQLGEVITDWIRRHPRYVLVDKLVLQSSDAEFHCLTIVVLYRYTTDA